MMTWRCVQNGAREHYAIPRALNRSGRLETLFTEFWAGPVLRHLAFGPLRPLATRFHPELSSAHVVSWTWKTVCREIQVSGLRFQVSADSYACFIRDGRWFSVNIRDYLVRHETDVRGKVIFSYDTTALELFRWAKERGAFCVLGQMDPGRMEMEQVREEEKRWPRWTVQSSEVSSPLSVVRGQRSAVGDSLNAYFQRREQEWELADVILVNSRWSFDALVQQGVPAEKLVVIPLCFENRSQKSEVGSQKSESSTSSLQLSTSHPLRVLFLGQVNVRKGIQYLVAAAKLLENEPVQFDVVGKIGISAEAVKSAPDNMTFHGPVSRDRVAEWYERSDVFVLPTLSDGFALTQLEALAHGLPVIATHNCGEVVTDGVDGFVVPARDPDALAQAIRRFLAEPGLLERQRTAALEKSKHFTLDKLAERLAALEDKLRLET